MTQILRAPGVNEAVNLSGLGLLPGIVTSVRVRGNFEIEKKRMEGTSGSANLPKGFRDAAVEITLELLPGDTPVEAQIKQLEAAFKQGGVNTAKPLRIVNQHLDARGIARVLFVGLETSEDNEWDSTLATLSFVEYEQITLSAEKGAATAVVSGPEANLNADTGGGGGSGGGAAAQQPSVAESFASGGGAGATQAKAEATAPYPAVLNEVVKGGGPLLGF